MTIEPLQLYWVGNAKKKSGRVHSCINNRLRCHSRWFCEGEPHLAGIEKITCKSCLKRIEEARRVIEQLDLVRPSETQ